MPLVKVTVFLSWSTGNGNTISNDTQKVLYRMIGRTDSTAEHNWRSKITDRRMSFKIVESKISYAAMLI